jgi:hypothetical protein
MADLLERLKAALADRCQIERELLNCERQPSTFGEGEPH